jgi:hypothetical protein
MTTTRVTRTKPPTYLSSIQSHINIQSPFQPYEIEFSWNKQGENGWYQHTDVRNQAGAAYQAPLRHSTNQIAAASPPIRGVLLFLFLFFFSFGCLTIADPRSALLIVGIGENLLWFWGLCPLPST